LAAHTRSCKRKKDTTLVLDPDVHSILRPFGFIEDRFYIIRQECGTVMAWHVANLRGPHAQRMIDEMWEQLASHSNLPVEQAKRLEKIHWDAADFPRCPHCGAPPPHPKHIPKGAAYTEADRHLIPPPPNANPPQQARYHQYHDCVHKPASSVAQSGNGRALFKKYNQEKAMKKPQLQLAAGKIKNVVEEKALGVIFSATASTLPAAQHRVNVAWGAFNGLRSALVCKALELPYKMMIYRAMVMAVLLWGCEVLSVNNATGAMVTFNLKCLAAILGRPLSQEEYANPPVDVIAAIVLRQLLYLGHRLRGPPTSQPLRALLTRIAVRPGSKIRERAAQRGSSGSGKSARGGGERPSEKFPEETRQARSAEYVRDNGPNPEDVDFLMDRTQQPFTDSMFGLTEFESFAKMFDAAQDREGWKKMAENRAKAYKRPQKRGGAQDL
jgi:hypothetical protein